MGYIQRYAGPASEHRIGVGHNVARLFWTE
jgi:hypothetical protein